MNGAWKRACGGLCCALAAHALAAAEVRTATLADGWTFRLEGEAEARPVSVPHDWGVERGFLKAGACPGQGDLPFVGRGLYKRAFDGFNPPAGGRTYLTLDGVQCRSVVKLNGKVVGGRPFGYASETIDVTDALKAEGNLLEVEAENVPASSRWYPGSGIFRDVTVRVCPPDHVKPNTLFVRTLAATEKSARVAVSFEWRGGVSNFAFTVENPRLWSPESPALHALELFGEKFRYGIRTAEFDPRRGFFLNGVHRQMRGVCLHHDLGPVGAAFDRDFARRQLALLKEMGCDAIRTSHNPPAAALLDLCDEMGLMVMDEAFDMWEEWKGDYANFWKEWHARDLADFVRRDRSHPSVVMWSVGNELTEHGEKDPARAMRIAEELRAIVRANDPTRPVTFGCWKSAPMWNGCQKTVDAFGANYLPFKYAEFARRNPEVGLVATETSSCVSSRGEYFFPVVASPIAGEGDLRRRRDEGRGRMVRGGQMSGYDLWGPHANDYPPDVEFEHQERNPQVYGEFVWTGFDYLGEPDPCAKSGGRSSYFGIFDLAGLPKDRYWLYKAHWRPDEPTAHILPHWTWPGREGEATPVHVYSSGDEAELFVNGVSQGRRRRGRYEYRFRWDDVRYQPGELRVKTWKGGRPWAEDVVRTAGAPVRVARTVRRFGRLAFVTFALVDAAGTVCPNADRALAFTVRPGTRLLSLCNGDASSREDFRGASMRTFHGLLVAAVEGPAEGLALAPPVKVVFDTDMLTDYDDAGALACLHALADAGECEILATVSCTRGNASVAACEAINGFYGRPDIPVGCTKDIGFVGAGDPNGDRNGHAKFFWLRDTYAQYVRHPDSADAPDALDVYRRVLAAQPDASVVICSVGFLSNMRRLVEAEPALVARKVKLWVAMACRHPKGVEYNSSMDAESSAIAISRWPTPIVFSDFEYGLGVFAGRRLVESPHLTGPVKDVYAMTLPARADCSEKTGDRAEGHPCWDQTAVLYAVRGAGDVFGLERGTYRMVGTDGADEWIPGEDGRHMRLTEKMPKKDVGALIDELMCRPPVRIAGIVAE